MLVARQTGSFELLKLESHRVLLSHIRTIAQAEHVLGQVDQFLITRVVKVRYDGNSIVKLEPKREDRVVNENQILQIPVPDDSQILDEDSFVRLEAVLAIESETNEGAFRVNQIDYSVSVLLVTRREDAHLVLGSTLR